MSNDKKNNLLEKKKIENKTEKKLEKKLDIALTNRNFEISLFWQRSNYFLVLNSAIALAFFSFLGNNYNGKGIPIIMAVFGFFVSILWLGVLFGGKFWQNYWEAKLKEVEQSLEAIPNTPITILFNNNEKHDEEVVNGFINNKNNENNENGKLGLRKRFINHHVLKKPSVSNTMIYLSIGFIELWLILICYSLRSTL